MAQKKMPGLITILKNLLQAHVKRLSDLTYLALLETQLASKSLVSMLCIAVLLLFLLGSTWLSILFLIFFVLIAFEFSSIFSSCVIVALNLILLLIAFFYIQKIKKNLSFPATRRQIANISMANKEPYE